MDGMPDEIEALWTQGAEMLKDAGAEIATSRCRTRNTRCPPIT
jgi:hypothetical protein